MGQAIDGEGLDHLTSHQDISGHDSQVIKGCKCPELTERVSGLWNFIVELVPFFFCKPPLGGLGLLHLCFFSAACLYITRYADSGCGVTHTI